MTRRAIASSRALEFATIREGSIAADEWCTAQFVNEIEFFATCPKGSADLLAQELRACGVAHCHERAGGVAFAAELRAAYQACLWSRVANSVLLILDRFAAPDAEALYAGVSAIDWAAHLGPDQTFAVSAKLTHAVFSHSLFVAQKTKDAIVDQLRTATGARPNVDPVAPDLCISVYVRQDVVQVALDLAGGSLHARGYRVASGAAPLKENLAAALLLRTGWPAIAHLGGSFIDPMCGSGTLLVEAAMIAADLAPGLLRGCRCSAWRGHDSALWTALIEDAQQRRDTSQVPPIFGFDTDRSAIRAVQENIAHADLAQRIAVAPQNLRKLQCPSECEGVPGLLVTNPPYGKRLSGGGDLASVYRDLGALLTREFDGWTAAVFTGDPRLGHELGLHAHRTHTFYNGAIECKLLRFKIDARARIPRLPVGSQRIAAAVHAIDKRGEGSGALMFANRLAKNLRSRTRWARRAGVSCFRLYDADMPEYALAIDVYDSTDRWLHVQEYAAPASVDPARAKRRLDEALAQLPRVLEVPPERIVFKRRTPQRGRRQYQRFATTNEALLVTEGGLRFEVNLRDHLDTGLFLDQRLTRAHIRSLASGRRMLNLFAYTASASVYAAEGGASRTLSVDNSATYTAWARRNLALNGYREPTHHVERAECCKWLAENRCREFDLIFLDPPSFSNAKSTPQTLAIQRDHVALIDAAMALLVPRGMLIFSTNLRRFRLDSARLDGYHTRNITAQTMPLDFARQRRIHHCFEIEHRCT